MKDSLTFQANITKHSIHTLGMEIIFTVFTGNQMDISFLTLFTKILIIFLKKIIFLLYF